MKFLIRGENIEVTPAIREHVEKKLSKIKRYFNEEMDFEMRVNLKVYNNKQKIEVTAPLKSIMLRAEESNHDLYVAINLVVDKLERQIRKHKTKINRKAREKSAMDFVFTEHVPAFEEEEENLDVVRRKHIHLKAMTIEEAILQMNMIGHNFFVFNNGDTGETNVVYVRKDGKYAVLETK
jgi:putative sigma-54 modulation protein